MKFIKKYIVTIVGCITIVISTVKVIYKFSEMDDMAKENRERLDKIETRIGRMWERLDDNRKELEEMKDLLLFRGK